MFAPAALRRLLSRVGVALATVLVIVVMGLVGVNREIDDRLAGIRRTDVDLDEDLGPGEPANFLLIGSDTREFVRTDGGEEAFGDPDEQSGQRSDTIMILHVDPDAKKTLLVSIPRDLWVDIPGIGMSKINAAYNEGPNKTLETIRTNFDIPIHHYIEVNFNTFQGIVEAIGSIPIFFPAPARDEVTGLDVQATGCVPLDPAQALAYVRSRNYQQLEDGRWKTDPTADLGRVARQQNFMRRVAAEAVKRGFSDPRVALKVADSVDDYLVFDQDLERNDLFKLLNSFRGVDPNDPTRFETMTLPVRAPKSGEVRTGGQAVLVLDQPAADQLFQQLREFGPPPELPPAAAPTDVAIRVLNGSGVNGAAATAINALGGFGFQPAGTGNSPQGTVALTEIRYRTGDEAKARVVLEHIGGVGKLVPDDAIVDADVVLVLGKDFAGVKATEGDTPTTAAGATATTAAPPEDTEAAAEPLEC